MLQNSNSQIPKPKGGWISFIIALLSAVGGVLLEHFTNLIK